MTYDIERESKNRTSEPTLEEMIEKSLQILKKNPKGFFLLVESKKFSLV
jgi:alkaline phosphatase